MTTTVEDNATHRRSAGCTGEKLFPVRVLVMCTGNSARSIMAEALFNTLGHPAFQASSAGSRPTGRVHPLALEQIRLLGVSTGDYRSKSWREFNSTDAADFDIILTVCDNAAAEPCPLYNGGSVHAHWSLSDPAAIKHDTVAARLAFAECFASVKARVISLTALAASTSSPSQLIDTMRSFEAPSA